MQQSLSLAILHVQNQWVFSYVALAIEKSRASGKNIKLFGTHTIANQRHIAMGAPTCSFINGTIPSNFALAFKKY